MSRWSPGERVGDHELVERLGAGGMGEVWRARHLPTGAERALKTLSPLATGEDRLRFQREAEALARLDGHRNLVRVHAAGLEGATPWVAMELVPGGDLADRLRRGPLPPADAAALVAALARAVAHAHARGVLHRDIKPANVLLDPSGAPRLTDFGLARLQDARSLTGEGAILGTPAWLAPEQARGERADVRTDVWGLGAVLYHALCGRPPAQGATELATLAAVLEGAIPPPRAVRPEVPVVLDELCRRALAPRREDRFPDATALATALETWSAPAPGWSRSPGAGPWIVVALLVSVAVGVAVTTPRALAPHPTTPPSRPLPPPSEVPVLASPRDAPAPEVDRPRSSFADRYRGGALPLATRRPDALFEAPELSTQVDWLGALTRNSTQLTEAEAVQRFPALVKPVQAGLAAGQSLLARLIAEREPERALELLWEASREPEPDVWASLRLAELLDQRGDSEGARWVLGEAAARARVADRPDLLGDTALSVAHTGEVGRALRLLQGDGGDPGRARLAWHQDSVARVLELISRALERGTLSPTEHLELELARFDPRPRAARVARRWHERGPRLLEDRDAVDAAFRLP